jgi:hypothetical protein
MSTNGGDPPVQYEVGDRVRVIAKHDERIWSVGKIVRRCNAGETGDYLLQFDDDPKLATYRREDLYQAEAAWLKQHAPGNVQNSNAVQAPIGWYPDPSTGGERYWNGDEWAGQAAGTNHLSRPSVLVKTGLGLLAAIAISFAAHACSTTHGSRTRHNSHAPANTTTVSPERELAVHGSQAILLAIQ